jgi:AhpD family alkylhydroperoxidase
LSSPQVSDAIAAWRRALVACGAVVLVDQVTKAIVVSSLADGQREGLVLGIELTNTANRGLAFGIGQGRGFVLAVTIAALALVLVWFAIDPRRPGLAVSVGLLAGGALGTVERELLALLVAQDNDCEYCVSAHTFRGGRMRISDEDLLRARQADSPDPHTRAVLRLARSVLSQRGRVADAELAEARAAGVTDAEVLEVVAHVALNALSNYVNHVARPPLDFPRVRTATDGAAA